MLSKSNFPKSLIALGIILTVLAAGIWIIMSGQISARPKPQARPDSGKLVKAVKVKEASNIQSRSFPGLVQATRETRLAFRVGGPLVDLNMKIGQQLKKNDPIAKIDQRDFKLNIRRLKAALAEANAHLEAMKTGARAEDIAALEADLAAAKAQFSEAETNLTRYKNLFEQKAVAEASFDSAKTAYDTALARMKAARNALAKGRSGARQEDIDAMNAKIMRLKADMEGARHAFNDTILKAPFDGFIHEIFVENFETVGPGQPIISFMDISKVEIKTSIPQEIIARKQDWGIINCIFDEYPLIQVNAHIQELGERTSGPGQTFPLIVRAEVPDQISVRPGMAAEVKIELKSNSSHKKGLKVSASAVFADSKGSPCVWLIDPKTMTVRKTIIQPHDISKDLIQITEGIKPGDWIVTAGARFLRKGQKVRVMGQGE